MKMKPKGIQFTICFIILNHFSDSYSQITQNINVLLINEENNVLAEKAFEEAKEFVRRNPSMDLVVDSVVAVGNRKCAKAFLENVCNKYNNMLLTRTMPHVVLDFTITGITSETVKAFTAALALPTVSGSFGQAGDLRLWRSLTANQTKFLLQVMPPADILTESIKAIAMMQKINNVAILYDNLFVMEHKHESLLRNICAFYIITPVKSLHIDAITAQLESLRDKHMVNFFIVGSLTTIKIVLNAADEIRNFRNTTAWYAVSLENGDISCGCKDVSVMFIKPTPDINRMEDLGNIKTTSSAFGEPEITSAFYFDLSIRTFLTVKALIDAGKWPTDMKYITCNEYNGNNTPNRTLDLRLAFKKKRRLTHQNEYSWMYAPIYIPEDDLMNGRSYMEFTTDLSVVNIKNGVSMESHVVGSWKAGLSNPVVLIDPEKIANYSAIPVYTVVIMEHDPFIMRDDNAPKGFKGFCIDLIEEISQIVKFDYKLILSRDGNFGTTDENGNWNGIIKELIEKRADIGLATLSVMAERANVIDFTLPYYDLVGTTILMKLPKNPKSLFKFLTVLENEVWFSILAAYFCTSFLMWVFDKWSPYSYQNNRERYKDDEEKREFTFKECLWFCMTSLTPQGGGIAPKNVSGRLLAATWWLFGFIVLASYTANLAAFLTVSRMDTVIESLDDLSKQYKIQYAPLNGSSAMTYFQRMANIEVGFYNMWRQMSLNESLSDVERAKFTVWDYPLSEKYSKLWRAMKEAGLPNTMEEAVRRVKDSKSSSEGFAWLCDATAARYHAMTNCDLQMVDKEYSRKPYAIAVQKGSSLKAQFNNAIIQLQNTQKLKNLKEKWWNNNPEAKKCERQDEQSDGISIQNIGGVFIVIFMGIGLACIMILLEYWWYKSKKQSNSRVNEVVAALAVGNKTETMARETKANENIKKSRTDEIFTL